MRCHDSHSYRVELYGSAGEPLGQAAVAMNWEPIVESARFGAIRSKRFPASGQPFVATVSPRWSARLGQPYVAGLHVALSLDGSEALGQDFGTGYFEPLASEASERLVAEGKLHSGDLFRWVMTAYPRDASAQVAAVSAPHAGSCTPTPLTLHEGSLVDRLAEAETDGEVRSEDLPVFLPQSVLEEISRLAREAGARETGGVLIGDLCRDDAVPEVFGLVAAQIPATHARGELTRLTFTPETWSEIDQVLRLRGRDEIMLGWWHSHPAYEWSCKRCSVERRRSCPVAGAFLSEHDRALHRAVFPRAFSLALVVNLLTAEEHTYSMFGWRDGLLVSRGFHRLPGAGAR